MCSYIWRTGGWSECSVSAVMSEGQATVYANNKTLCGGGLHKRHVYCVKNDTGMLINMTVTHLHFGGVRQRQAKEYANNKTLCDG